MYRLGNKDRLRWQGMQQRGRFAAARKRRTGGKNLHPGKDEPDCPLRWNFFVHKPIPPYLRIHLPDTEAAQYPAEIEADARAELDSLFRAAFGVSINEILGDSSSIETNHLSANELAALAAKSLGAEMPAVPKPIVHRLAGALDYLMEEQRQLWQRLAEREAELAAGAPVMLRRADATEFGQRLQSILRCGAEAVECQAAGLYLLDAATTELKLRSCWGIPSRRLLDPPRPLEGAVADLEALSGHAVVLENDLLNDHWNTPERSGAAVCVPVSSSAIPLGTMWVFSSKPRSFSDRETNILEVVAGRLAADLERETLIGDLRDSRDATVSLAAPQAVSPQVAGWRIAGSLGEKRGNAFYDWFANGDSQTIVTGRANSHGFQGGSTAIALRAGLRAFGESTVIPDELLGRGNRLLWQLSAGDECASATVAVCQPRSSLLKVSVAGNSRAIVCRADGREHSISPAMVLGLDPDATFVTEIIPTEPGDTLLLINNSDTQQFDSLAVETLAKLVHELNSSSVKTLANEIGRLLADDSLHANACDGSVAVIRRTND